MIGDKNLTGVSNAQMLTFPGQAHFAIPGATAHCGDCWFWSPQRKGDKKAVCGKAVSMQKGIRPRAFPAYATICQYFTKTAPDA
jgi:hypothetical protein